MKLVYKIILANTLGIIIIILISVFSYHEFNMLKAKLSFVEIADTLNASFLKMRLAEKNYFLYKDVSSLQLIKAEIRRSKDMTGGMKRKIIVAVGHENFTGLVRRLDHYAEEIDKIGTSDKIGISGQDIKNRQLSVREAGRDLKLFSGSMVRLERKKVNGIISASLDGLLYFFSLAILVAIMGTYLFFSNMFRNLSRIERATNSISKGNFNKIAEWKMPNNELGSVMRAINSMCDELQTRHEKLIQSRKLASIGILTAGVAHELGNPLNNISMVAQTFLELYDDLPDEERLEYMETVLQECGRIKDIVKNLLDFSKPKDTEFRVLDINAIIKKTLKLVRNMINVAGIKTELDLQEKLPEVFIDEDKIQGVLVNLINNAIQAMSAKGTLFIRTIRQEKEDKVIIEIEDTGKGIPPEFLSNIFDPFFSTKGTEGTGLGLSISYGIIKRHNGKIRVKSKVGVGTTFIIELPVYISKEEGDGCEEDHGD
ncbi:MAG: GHKL domain-containing protein [Deltaproteobacteria bacterium]|nr:GHKL domain-containing protein [Deltaproteobacteria bacterium]